MRQYCADEHAQGGPLAAPGDLDPNRSMRLSRSDNFGGLGQGPGGRLGQARLRAPLRRLFLPARKLGNRGSVDAAGMCQAQCPGAETEAFSMGAGDDIEHAVGEGGKSYMELENALRYQKATVPGCSCRKADQSWGQALKPAEDMLGGSDTMIDSEKAAKMSRPPAPTDARKPAGTPRAGSAARNRRFSRASHRGKRQSGGAPAGRIVAIARRAAAQGAHHSAAAELSRATPQAQPTQPHNRHSLERRSGPFSALHIRRDLALTLPKMPPDPAKSLCWRAVSASSPSGTAVPVSTKHRCRSAPIARMFTWGSPCKASDHAKPRPREQSRLVASESQDASRRSSPLPSSRSLVTLAAVTMASAQALSTSVPRGCDHGLCRR